jgi:hypothetical protein
MVSIKRIYDFHLMYLVKFWWKCFILNNVNFIDSYVHIQNCKISERKNNECKDSFSNSKSIENVPQMIRDNHAMA